jgi:hypothetical protein
MVWLASGISTGSTDYSRIGWLIHTGEPYTER